MASQTLIPWAHHTFNPWWGCGPAALPSGQPHSGCQHCYVQRMLAEQQRNADVWGPAGRRVKTQDQTWNRLREWQRQAHTASELRRVCLGTLGDIFEPFTGPVTDASGQLLAHGESLPLPDTTTTKLIRPLMLRHLRRRLFTRLAKLTRLRCVLPTKYPHHVPRLLAEAGVRQPLSNVMLAASVSDPDSYQQLVPPLLAQRERFGALGLFVDPLVSEVDVTDHVHQLDWVVLGGESGPGCRRTYLDHLVRVIEVCREAETPVYVQQLGASVWDRLLTPDTLCVQLAEPAGRDAQQWPSYVRVRQLPQFLCQPFPGQHCERVDHWEGRQRLPAGDPVALPGLSRR